MDEAIVAADGKQKYTKESLACRGGKPLIEYSLRILERRDVRRIGIVVS